MLGAVQRLVFISIGTVVVTALATVFVRWAGGQQSFKEPPHPWFALAEWELVQADVCSASSVTAGRPDQLVWLPVHNTKDGWSVKCGTFTPLTTFLQRQTHLNWILLIDSKETTSLDRLIQDVSAHDKKMNFGIVTPAQIVARYLRKKAPQWVYGADAATMLRLHLFSSLWLETAFDFWPDFVLQVPGDKNTQLNEREFIELKRRKKRILKVEFTY